MAEMLTQPEGTYWDFLRDDRHLGYGDGREVIVGETLTVDGEIELCKRGLHASERVIDALKYAPGSVVCLVTLGGKVLHRDDKSAGQERTALWVYDATRLLREFACNVAEAALLAEREAGRKPSRASFAAIAVSRRYARGKSTDEELSAAYWAAYRAVYSTAAIAAHNPGYSAAADAASDTGYTRAYEAANRAADCAATRAAWSAAGWVSYEATLSAAGRVAYYAAGWSAQQQQNDTLTSMLMAEYNKEKQN